MDIFSVFLDLVSGFYLAAVFMGVMWIAKRGEIKWFITFKSSKNTRKGISAYLVNF